MNIKHKRILLLSVSIFIIIFGCKKSFVESIFKPESRIKPPWLNDYTNVRIEVNPEVAPDGTVFGGFTKRFKFKDQWYVLADYMYSYDTEKKIATQTGSNVVLRIDDDKTITIYGKNLPFNQNRMVQEYEDYHDDYMNNAWYNLKINSLTIDEDKIYHEWNWLNYWKYRTNMAKGTAGGKIDVNGVKYDLEGLNAEWLTSLHLRRSGRGITYTKDLLNWTTETNYGVYYDDYIKFPQPSLDIARKDDRNFNGSTGLKGGKTVYFKGYLYVLGGYTELSENGLKVGYENTADITGTKYYRIAAGKDYQDANNWEVLNAPEDIRKAWPWIRVDGDKLYMNYGFKVYADVDLRVAVKNEDRYKQRYSDPFVNTVFSTRDGISWSPDTVYNYERASHIDYDYYDIYIGPPTDPLFPKKNPVETPYENDYAEYNGKYFYIAQSDIKIPEDRIKEMAKRGDTNFSLQNEDMKYISLDQLLVSDDAKKPNFTSVSVINPLPASMVWLRGSSFLFNLNNKLVRLVDYAYTDSPVTYDKEVRDVANIMEYWKGILNDINNGKSSSYSKEEACYQYLYFKAYYDAYSYYNTNASYYMPDEAITHYSIDFRY